MRHRVYFVPAGRQIWPKPMPSVFPTGYVKTVRPVIYTERDVVDLLQLKDAGHSVQPPCDVLQPEWHIWYRAFFLRPNTYGVTHFIAESTSVQYLYEDEWHIEEMNQIREGNYVQCFKQCGWAVHLGQMYCERHDTDASRWMKNYLPESSK